MNEQLKPVLLCSDGSDHARHAISASAEVLRTGPVLVVTVWESVLSFAHRHPLPGSLGVIEDVVDELDSSARNAAESVASDGSEAAQAVGFAAEPLPIRALGRAGERTPATVWETIVETAEERDAAAVVVGSRGLTALRSAVLGSVSYGVVHHCKRPVLVVPLPVRTEPA